MPPKDGEMTSGRRALQWEGPLTGSGRWLFAKYEMSRPEQNGLLLNAPMLSNLPLFLLPKHHKRVKITRKYFRDKNT